MTYSWIGQVPHSWFPPATHEWVTNSIELSGRLREAVNEHARVSFRYNSLGLPVGERCDTHLIERSYDKHGLIVPFPEKVAKLLRKSLATFSEKISHFLLIHKVLSEAGLVTSHEGLT